MARRLALRPAWEVPTHSVTGPPCLRKVPKIRKRRKVHADGRWQTRAKASGC